MTIYICYIEPDIDKIRLLLINLNILNNCSECGQDVFWKYRKIPVNKRQSNFPPEKQSWHTYLTLYDTNNELLEPK